MTLSIIKKIKSLYSKENVESAFPPKQGKVYDIFTFFNELDLLEIRLNILDPYVDYFVIIEATETFSGKSKPLYYEQHKERFAQWHHKIIHYVTSDTPATESELEERLKGPLTDIEREVIDSTLTTTNFPKGAIHWMKEFYQKESIKKSIVELHDEDHCFVGDADEIWNPAAHFDFEGDGMYKLRQDAYVYYLNNRSSEPWAGTLLTKYKNIRKACLNHLRDRNKTRYTYVKHAGWHFTNMGGADQIRTKLESYGHQEFNTDSIKSEIEQRIKDNKDFIGRKFKFWKDETHLPEYIKNNKEKYKHLLL